MKFGVREICDVVLKAKAKQTIGNRTFFRNEPVLYFDSLKTSSMEGATTTVYAQGGKGNSRLIAWEGERTVTFTMEDALISAEGFAILSGAGLIAASALKPIFVHATSQVQITKLNEIVLDNVQVATDEGCDVFIMKLDENGEISSEPCVPATVNGVRYTAPTTGNNGFTTILCAHSSGPLQIGDIVLVDYYVKKTTGVQQIEISPDAFGGNYYLEASTLFRRQADGVDLPAEFIIPNCKVQSNFTFTMASSGDPSTFTFTIDAFPDYTKFDRTRKVLAAIQIVEEGGIGVVESREACVIPTP